jgi:hypothetical protein
VGAHGRARFGPLGCGVGLRAHPRAQPIGPGAWKRRDRTVTRALRSLDIDAVGRIGDRCSRRRGSLFRGGARRRTPSTADRRHRCASRWRLRSAPQRGRLFASAGRHGCARGRHRRARNCRIFGTDRRHVGRRLRRCDGYSRT